MVSRSAYAQLDYSPLLLAGTVLGMALIYLAPPLLALFGQRARASGRRWRAWLLMALAFQPMLRFYRLSPLWGLALPVIGAALHAFTVQSAHRRSGAAAAACGRAAPRRMMGDA